MSSIDFTLQNHGSIYLLIPETDSAIDWLEDNVSEDSTFFGSALVIESRYVPSLVHGFCEDGFTFVCDY